jgi:hypothetical protein
MSARLAWVLRPVSRPEDGAAPEVFYCSVGAFVSGTARGGESDFDDAIGVWLEPSRRRAFFPLLI